jgi:hypothetical protein
MSKSTTSGRGFLARAMSAALLVFMTACAQGSDLPGDEPCAGDSACPEPQAGAVKRVFVTSATFPGGALGGASGADERCYAAARAAELGGTWKAWMSTSSEDAIDRIEDVGPWYLVNSATKVFNNKANLTTVPLASITLDEQGKRHGPFTQSGLYVAWTGTSSGGVKTGETCSDWMDSSFDGWGTYGYPAGFVSQAPSQQWGGDSQYGNPCDEQAGLICFEQ